MNKVLGLLLVVAIIVGAVPYARGLGAPSLPPGVSAENWISFGDAAGFVIRHPLPGDATLRPGMVKGYFMVRKGNNWLKVDSDQDVQVQPAIAR
jgi:hypothetical protein